jgi:hypothetical protein
LEKEPQPESAAKPPVDIAKIRDQIKQAVGGRALDLANDAMDGVKNGHYLPMKYLFEVIGLYPASAVAESPEDDSLAKILLRKLGVDPELVRPQTKVSKDSVESWPSATGDAVE